MAQVLSLQRARRVRAMRCPCLASGCLGGHARLHLGDVLPEAFGHLLHLQLGVVAFAYAEAVEVPYPCILHMQVVSGLVWWGDISYDEPPASAVPDPGHLVGFIEDDELLGVESSREPRHEQGNHFGVGVATGEPDAVF